MMTFNCALFLCIHFLHFVLIYNYSLVLLSCDSGGDCECLCDAIAAFNTYCNEIGYPARWRHQRLCRKSKFIFLKYLTPLYV